MNDKDIALGYIEGVQVAAGDVISVELGDLSDTPNWVIPDGTCNPGDILVSTPDGSWTWQAPQPGIDFERDVIQVRAENIELRKRIERLERDLERMKRRG